jgi:serine/threonine-protein kinase RsbW
MNFSCEVRPLTPSFLLVRLKGMLDAGTAVEMEMALSSHLRNPAVKTIVLEVPELTFVSSSGLRVMMVIIKTLVPRDGKLYMVGAQDQVAALFRMSGMTKWINFRDCLQDCEAN